MMIPATIQNPKKAQVNSDHPAVFMDWSVRAILADIKTQTRRIISLPRWADREQGFASFEIDDDGKPVIPCAKTTCLAEIPCPYGKVGDIIWVRETWVPEFWSYEFGPNPPIPVDRPHFENKDDELGHYYLFPHYRATDPAPALACDDHEGGPCCHWKSPRFMPHWASRISLRVTGVSVERLGVISLADCFKEGAGFWAREKGYTSGGPANGLFWFRNLWNEANKEDGRTFIDNPWVWVITFERIRSLNDAHN